MTLILIFKGITIPLFHNPLKNTLIQGFLSCVNKKALSMFVAI